MHAKRILWSLEKDFPKIYYWVMFLIWIPILAIGVLIILSYLISFFPDLNIKLPENCSAPYDQNFDNGEAAWFEWACKKYKKGEFYGCWGNSQSFVQWCTFFKKYYID